MLWACIALPELALDVVRRSQPDPEAPLVLVDGPATCRSLVAVNAAAARTLIHLELFFFFFFSEMKSYSVTSAAHRPSTAVR